MRARWWLRVSPFVLALGLAAGACSSTPDVTIDAPDDGGAAEGGLDGAADPDAEARTEAGVPVDAAEAAAPAVGASFSFVVVGCNRVEKGDIDPGVPSTANVEQLTRTFADIAALSPPPAFFFFAGDMVYGYADGPTLEAELTAWLSLYQASPLPAAGVALVPVPGNHESQKKKGSQKVAYVDAETTWVKVMAPYIRGSNGPGVGGADGLATDQSKLSYSFDHLGTHFVVLDTDPVGRDSQVPAAWVAADVAAARSAGAKHVFAIGHKPAYPSPLSGEGGLSAFPAVRDAFWSALESAQAEAMLAAHNHLWWKIRPTKTWQIVAGNGGSLLESGVSGAQAYYGFTHVIVDASGSVTAKSYGRDVPAAGYSASAPAATYPTTIRETVDLTWK